MTTTERHDTTERAAHHVRAAADLLENNDTTEQLFFSPGRVLATQLALIADGLSPQRCSPSPIEAANPAEHLAEAVDLLDGAIHLEAPPELMVWTARLRELRAVCQALTTRS